MHNKIRLRKKYFSIRKKKYFEIKNDFFNPLVKLIKRNYKKKYVSVSSYYPARFEVNTIKLFETKLINKLKIFLPVVKDNYSMHFFDDL